MRPTKDPAAERRAAARDAAAAVHRRVMGTLGMQRRAIEFGEVVQVRPVIIVEMHESGTVPIILREEEELQLSDKMRWWEVNYGFELGDTFLLTEAPTVGWVAFDAVTGRRIDAGLRPSKPAATFGDPMLALDSTSDVTYSGPDPQGGIVTVTPDGHHMVRKIEVYDKDGIRLGWVPVWDNLP